LLVGTTNNNVSANSGSSNGGINIQTAGVKGVISAAAAQAVIYLNRLGTADGDIAVFRKDGTTVGSIGAAAGPVAYIVLNETTSDNVSALKGAGGAILPSTNAGADKDGTMNLGSSAARFESLYLSNGIVGNSNNITISTDGGTTDHVTVDTSGNLLVGTTSSIGIGDTTGNGFQVNSGGNVNIKRTCTTSTQGLLHLNNIGTQGQVVEFYQDGSQVGNISVTSSVTTYNTSSDYRLKENVVELTGATGRLKQLEPKRFNFIADTDTTVDGFIAHEVQSVVPEAITGTHNEVDADGNPVYQGIDQSKLVPLLVATIKELEARITALENA